MKILITGGEGFIGSYVAKKLYSLGANIITYDLKSDQNILDIMELNKYMKGVDVVVHLAAFVSVPKSWDLPNIAYMNNIIGTQVVMESAIKNGVKKIIMASSSAVYEPYSSPYALSKYADEQIFKMYSDKIQTIVFRFFNVFGPGQSRDYAPVFPAFYDSIKEKGFVNIYGDGKQSRDFTYVEDVASVVSEACLIDIEGTNLTIDVGKGKSHTVKYVAEFLAREMGLDRISINYLPARKEIKHSKANTWNLQNIIGYKCKYTLEEGIKQFVKLNKK